MENLIRRMIDDSGCTYCAISKKSGISKTSMMNYYEGNHAPAYHTFIKIAKNCGFDVIIKKHKEKLPEVVIPDKLKKQKSKTDYHLGFEAGYENGWRDAVQSVKRSCAIDRQHKFDGDVRLSIYESTLDRIAEEPDRQKEAEKCKQP